MGLRIVYNNVADSSSVSASTTAGTLVATNLLKDIKSDIWRSTGTAATVTLTWATSQMLSMVALPFCNLTSSSTFRIKLYAEIADVAPVLDTGVVTACAGTPLGLWDWGNIPLGVNGYSYGGASYGVAWWETTVAKKMELIISDTTNTAGYIEASRVVAGTYYTPENDAELNVDWNVDDTSVNIRSAGNDLRSEMGSQNKCIKFNLSVLSAGDRATTASILRGNGKIKPLYVSLFPNDTDTSKEQHYQVYGKIKDSLSVGHSNWNLYSSTIEIEEA